MDLIVLLPSDNVIVKNIPKTFPNMPKRAVLLKELLGNALQQNKDGIQKEMLSTTLDLSCKLQKTAVVTSEKATGAIQNKKAGVTKENV
jgi:hypothetical protein